MVREYFDNTEKYIKRAPADAPQSHQCTEQRKNAVGALVVGGRLLNRD